MKDDQSRYKQTCAHPLPPPTLLTRLVSDERNKKKTRLCEEQRGQTKKQINNVFSDNVYLLPKWMRVTKIFVYP